MYTPKKIGLKLKYLQKLPKSPYFLWGLKLFDIVLPRLKEKQTLKLITKIKHYEKNYYTFDAICSDSIICSGRNKKIKY